MFRKNNKNIKKEGKDSTFSSEELVNVTDDKEFAAEEQIETDLSLHPFWNIPAEQSYVYRFLNNELDPLKPNQISLAGIELRLDENNDLVAIAFVRNSLNKSVKFEKVTLLALDHEQQVIARHEFDLAEIGDLPARSSRPWQFTFPQTAIVKKEFSTTGWSLAFEIKPKHALDLEESWSSSLSNEDQTKLRDLVNNLTPPKQGEVNFMGLQASQQDNGDLHVTVLIRNGSPNSITIQQLPLQVWDASNEIIAQGGFQLDDLQVMANTTKPWTFIFPASLLRKNDFDLSTWKVSTVQS